MPTAFEVGRLAAHIAKGNANKLFAVEHTDWASQTVPDFATHGRGHGFGPTPAGIATGYKSSSPSGPATHHGNELHLTVLLC